MLSGTHKGLPHPPVYLFSVHSWLPTYLCSRITNRKGSILLGSPNPTLAPLTALSMVLSATRLGTPVRKGQRGLTQLRWLYSGILLRGTVGWAFDYHLQSQTSQAKNPPAKAGDAREVGSIPGLGRFPGGRHSNPLQHSCLEYSTDRRAWKVTVPRAAKSRTQLSMHACTALENLETMTSAPKPTVSRARVSSLQASRDTSLSSPVKWNNKGTHLLGLPWGLSEDI